jgi:hypothetical protein
MYYNPDPKVTPPVECPNNDTVPALKVVPGGSVVHYSDAPKGEMLWREFEQLLMDQRRSYKSVEEWIEDGKITGPEALSYELKECEKKLEKSSKKLAKLEKLQAKQDKLTARIAILKKASLENEQP